ncbi:MAG: TetR family transcriptional regulator [Microthrixaceae bacterium]
MCTVLDVQQRAGHHPDMRERILDAAEACLRRDGIRRTTVAAVAAEADISRLRVPVLRRQADPRVGSVDPS